MALCWFILHSIPGSKLSAHSYNNHQCVRVSQSVTCPGPLLRLSAENNNNPVYSRPFPAHMFPSWVPELKPHGPPSPPPLYSAACAAPPGTLNISPWSCFLVHSPSLRTYCRWFTPVLGPRPGAGKRGRKASHCKKKIGGLNHWMQGRKCELKQICDWTELYLLLLVLILALGILMKT